MLEMITPSENLRQSMEFKRGTEKIVIELKMHDPKSLASLRKGIDEKKKALILNSYKILKY